GVDAAGRSCLVEEAPLTLKPSPAGTHRIKRVYETGSAPPPAPPRGRANYSDVRIGSGILRWLIIEFEPAAEFANHHTDTIDCIFVLNGTVGLCLDDGVHELQPDDCVVIPALDHGWKAGPAGCRLSVAAIGTPPHESG